MSLLSTVPPETLAQFITQAELYWRAGPDQRRGQAYYNYLYDVLPRVATNLTGSHVDPFYDDALIPDFLATLARLGVLK